MVGLLCGFVNRYLKKEFKLEQVEVSWTRIAKIYWLVLWRGMLFGVLGTLIAGFLLPVVLSPFDVSEVVFVWSARVVGALIGVIVGMVVFRMLFDKMFTDFEVVLVRPGSQNNQIGAQ